VYYFWASEGARLLARSHTLVICTIILPALLGCIIIIPSSHHHYDLGTIPRPSLCHVSASLRCPWDPYRLLVIPWLHRLSLVAIVVPWSLYNSPMIRVGVSSLYVRSIWSYRYGSHQPPTFFVQISCENPISNIVAYHHLNRKPSCN